MRFLRRLAGNGGTPCLSPWERWLSEAKTERGKQAAMPSQSPAVTALPEGEPRDCTTKREMERIFADTLHKNSCFFPLFLDQRRKQPQNTLPHPQNRPAAGAVALGDLAALGEQGVKIPRHVADRVTAVEQNVILKVVIQAPVVKIRAVECNHQGRGGFCALPQHLPQGRIGGVRAALQR